MTISNEVIQLLQDQHKQKKIDGIQFGSVELVVVDGKIKRIDIKESIKTENRG